jgi:hypothetical protein
MARSTIRSLNDRKLSIRNLIPTWSFTLERVTRIELALSAWEADVLPLNYTRNARQGPSGLADAART